MADTPNNFNDSKNGNGVSDISSDDLKSEMQKELDKLTGKAPADPTPAPQTQKTEDKKVTGSDFHPDNLQAEMQRELQKLMGGADLNNAKQDQAKVAETRTEEQQVVKVEPIQTAGQQEKPAPTPKPAVPPPAPKPVTPPPAPKPVAPKPTTPPKPVAKPFDSITTKKPSFPKAPPTNLPVGDGPSKDIGAKRVDPEPIVLNAQAEAVLKPTPPPPAPKPVTPPPAPKPAVPPPAPKPVTPPPAPKDPEVKMPAAPTPKIVLPQVPKVSAAPKPPTPQTPPPMARPVTPPPAPIKTEAKPVTQTPVPKPPTPVTPVIKKPVVPTPPPPKPKLNLPPIQKSSDVLLPPVPKPPAPTPVTQQEEPLLSRVHTLKSDMSGAVKRNNIALARSAIKSEERKEKKLKKERQAHRTGTMFALLSVLFILAGGTIFAYYFFFINKTDENPFEEKIIFPEPLIFSDIDETLELTELSPTESEEALVRIAKRPIERGELQSFNFFEREFDSFGNELSAKIIFGRDLLQRLGVRHPERLSRFMTGGMFGTYMTDVQHGFFIIEHDSYQRVFAEMLLWEEEKGENSMIGELYNLLAVGRSVPEDIYEEAELDLLESVLEDAMDDFTFSTGTTTEETATSTDPVATTTDPIVVEPEPEEELPEPSDSSPWKNEVIRNIDVRTLRNNKGELVLMYSFLGTRDILVITADMDTFEEIRTRFQTPNVTR